MVKNTRKSVKNVIKKGKGAYYSSGSRPNQTASSWGKARMYAYILGSPTRRVDHHITEKYKVKFIHKPNFLSINNIHSNVMWKVVFFLIVLLVICFNQPLKEYLFVEDYEEVDYGNTTKEHNEIKNIYGEKLKQCRRKHKRSNRGFME